MNYKSGRTLSFFDSLASVPSSLYFESPSSLVRRKGAEMERAAGAPAGHFAPLVLLVDVFTFTCLPLLSGHCSKIPVKTSVSFTPLRGFSSLLIKSKSSLCPYCS